MLKKMMRRWSMKAMERDLGETVRHAEELSDDELAAVLYATLASRVMLLKHYGGDFARFDLLLKTKDFDSQERIDCMGISMRLHSVSQSLLRRNDDAVFQFRTGLDYWQATFRAMSHPELLPLGRKLWRELLRGEDGLPSIVARNPAIGSIDNLLVVPSLLTPKERREPRV